MQSLGLFCPYASRYPLARFRAKHAYRWCSMFRRLLSKSQTPEGRFVLFGPVFAHLSLNPRFVNVVCRRCARLQRYASRCSHDAAPTIHTANVVLYAPFFFFFKISCPRVCAALPLRPLREFLARALLDPARSLLEARSRLARACLKLAQAFEFPSKLARNLLEIAAKLN